MKMNIAFGWFWPLLKFFLFEWRFADWLALECFYSAGIPSSPALFLFDFRNLRDLQMWNFERNTASCFRCCVFCQNDDGGWRGERNNAAQGFPESIKKHTEDNKAHRKHRHSEGDGYSLKRSKWQAGTLVNALRVVKIRSNLHTGQYASGVPSDHGQRQALVEPLSLPGVAWNVNKFLCQTAQ